MFIIELMSHTLWLGSGFQGVSLIMLIVVLPPMSATGILLTFLCLQACRSTRP